MTLDEPKLEEMLDLLGQIAAPEVECAMLATEGTPTVTYQGPEGFRTAWSEWMGGFEGIRLVLEEVIEFDRGVVVMAKQIGTTRFGVEIEQPSAMVNWFDEEGRLTRTEFHLDRNRARRSAGLDQSSQV